MFKTSWEKGLFLLVGKDKACFDYAIEEIKIFNTVESAPSNFIGLRKYFNEPLWENILEKIIGKSLFPEAMECFQQSDPFCLNKKELSVIAKLCNE